MNISRTGIISSTIVVMVLLMSACVENLFNIEEDKTNEDLVGVWYRYYIQTDTLRQGLPALIMFREDGSGTKLGVDDTGQVDVTQQNFYWTTTENRITVNDEEDSVLWSGSFELSENKAVLRFSYIRNHSDLIENFVKYTGAKKSDFVGSWNMVVWYHGAEKCLSLERILFSEDKTATEYLIPDLQDTNNVDVETFYWNTSGNYLIMLPPGQQTATVYQTSFSSDRLVCLANDEFGIRDSVIFVKDIGNIDTAGLGTWQLTSWKIDNTPYPMGAQTRTLYLYDSERGLWETVSFQGTTTEEFDWATNRGYMFFYQDDNPEVAWIHTYAVTDTTMLLKSDTEYIQGYGWATVEYKLKKISEE